MKITGPKPQRFLGHLAAFRADRLSFFTQCARTYGDVVRLQLPFRPILLFNRPDLIEQVLVTQAANFIKHFGLRMFRPILGDGLVTSEGEFWRTQRKLAAPAFQGSRLPDYARDMIESTERTLDGWNAKSSSPAEERIVRDVHADLMELTLEIACRTLFGTDAWPEPHAVGVAMHESLRAIEVRFGRLFPIPDWFPTPSNLRLRRALRTLNSVVASVIAMRRASPDTDGAQGNLLSMLLRSRGDDGSGMTDRQLTDEVRTILLAGHETTALALTYSLYLLAEHQGAQAALHEELSAALGDRPPTYADLAQLPYTTQVVAEAMRLYPPADVLGREAISDCTVNDVPVPRGTCVFMSQWVMHRDPRYFPDPLRFDPNRWTPAFQRSLPRFTYFPFGGGPRVCVGQAFASAEATLLLAAICRRFAFAPDPKFRLKLWPSITLRPRNGVRLLVTRR